MLRAAILTALFASNLAALPPLPGKPIRSPVIQSSNVTYETLLRLVCSDLQVEDETSVIATATNTIGIRELGSASPAPPHVEHDTEIASVRMVAALRTTLRTGRPWVLVSFAMNAGDSEVPVRKLGLFELSPVPRIIDIVAIPGSPDDPGDIEETMSLGGKEGSPITDLYVFETFHSNSSQGYQISTLLFVRSNRIEKIADVALMTSRAYGDVQEFDETQKISTLPDPGREYRQIVIRMTFKRVADDPEAGRRPLRRGYTRFYTAAYHWNAASKRFVTASKELEALDAFNQNPH